MSPRLLLLAALCLTASACNGKDDGDDDGTGTLNPATPATPADSDTPDPGTTGGEAPTTGSEPAGTTGDATASDATSAGPTTTPPDETTAAEGSTTAPAPTDGPGVLPGETGLDAFCRRYVECGGTYYADAQACIDESLGYWGECPSRRAALDAFGACMSEIECTDWNPDAYNPGSTPCAQEWSDLGASDPC